MQETRPLTRREIEVFVLLPKELDELKVDLDAKREKYKVVVKRCDHDRKVQACVLSVLLLATILAYSLRAAFFDVKEIATSLAFAVGYAVCGIAGWSVGAWRSKAKAWSSYSDAYGRYASKYNVFREAIAEYESEIGMKLCDAEKMSRSERSDKKSLN